jgi:hypothetical protein
VDEKRRNRDFFRPPVALAVGGGLELIIAFPRARQNHARRAKMQAQAVAGVLSWFFS